MNTLLNLFGALGTILLASASCSSDDASERPAPTPQPTSWEVYAAGYKRVDTKAVATVWKDGQELYSMTDGGNSWASGLCVDGQTVYTAGYEEVDGHIEARLWENGTLKYSLGTPGSNSYAYAVVLAGGDLYTAGTTTVDGAMTATVWRNGTQLYTYSVSPASSQARALLPVGTDLYVAGNLQTGGTATVAQIWKNADRTLTDGTAPGDLRSLILDGGVLCAAGSTGESAAVWRGGALLHTLTDGSSTAEAMSLCAVGGTLFTAGYYTTESLTEQGVVWQNGTQLYALANGSESGSIPYAIAAAGEELYTAGTRFGDSRRATIWKGQEIFQTLGRGEAFALQLVPQYE